DWPKKHSLVGDVRGRGLMIGVEIVKDKQTKEYAGPERDRIVELAFERGVLFLGCGPSTIRLAPPLVVTKDEADVALDVLDESINIADGAKEPMRAIAEARALPGVGLEGDRYALGQGTFFKPEPSYELTLIEAEAIEALRRDYAIELAPRDARRNLVTRDVPLNHLVGKEFFIGEVKIRGIRLCEPCDHLQHLTGQPVIKGLLHR